MAPENGWLEDYFPVLLGPGNFTSWELKGTPSANRALLRAVLRENPMRRPYFLEIALALGVGLLHFQM